MTIHEKLRKRNGTPEWIMDFAKAVCPENPELLLSTNEQNILTMATRKISALEAELDKTKKALRTVTQMASAYVSVTGNARARERLEKAIAEIDAPQASEGGVDPITNEGSDTLYERVRSLAAQISEPLKEG